jgi:hypothetical protein
LDLLVDLLPQKLSSVWAGFGWEVMSVDRRKVAKLRGDTQVYPSVAVARPDGHLVHSRECLEQDVMCVVGKYF